MFTADQIVAHLVGDYIIQSHWMATAKTKNSVAAGVYAVTYTLPFLFITQSPLALAVILVTHFFVDRYRLARIVVWAKTDHGRVPSSGPIIRQPATPPRRRPGWRPGS